MILGKYYNSQLFVGSNMNYSRSASDMAGSLAIGIKVQENSDWFEVFPYRWLSAERLFSFLVLVECAFLTIFSFLSFYLHHIVGWDVG